MAFARTLRTLLILSLLQAVFAAGVLARPQGAAAHLEWLRDDPLALREFLAAFPKGGELHTHLDGAVYAESYIRWAAEDGRCINFDTLTIDNPPCDAASDRPAVSAVAQDAATVNAMINAFSVRNYELGQLSGHDQFFATFHRFSLAAKGRQADMLAEVTARAGRQQVLYLEIMDSMGMRRARALAGDNKNLEQEMARLLADPAMDALVAETIAFTHEAEARRRELLGCVDPRANGCDVSYRYLAQVIRVYPLPQVLAQTVLSFKLMAADPLFVGLNFVAPEDHPVTLRDYTAQMKIIRAVAAHFPEQAGGVALHAGELAPPLVAPEYMRSNIRRALLTAGARRIGHGIDIVYEDNFRDTLRYMAEQDIAIEVNPTSNAVILGVEGDDHPFRLYREAGVPVVLSTDDEGVARIDLTHEYQRAVETWQLDYDAIREISRNGLAYAFLPGASLFTDTASGKRVADCRRDNPLGDLSQACEQFLAGSEKARLQWQLEKRFIQFENALH